MINLLTSLKLLREAPKPEPSTLEIEGRIIAVAFKRHARCKRMVLRISADGAGVVITLPPRASLAAALRFAETSKPWIARTMRGRPAQVQFQHAQTIMFQGMPKNIVATGGKRGLIALTETEIQVPGDAAHVARRLADWLKLQAKAELCKTSKHYAILMQAKFNKLTLRDQTTRWGSCSATGDLSYSWRLILAPSYVLDYVAAHEVAHLREMNHGPRFWRLVISHCKHAKEARNWLRLHGRELHRYQMK
jgi:predicted metal-dependent hydrolase